MTLSFVFWSLLCWAIFRDFWHVENYYRCAEVVRKAMENWHQVICVLIAELHASSFGFALRLDGDTLNTLMVWTQIYWKRDANNRFLTNTRGHVNGVWKSYFSWGHKTNTTQNTNESQGVWNQITTLFWYLTNLKSVSKSVLGETIIKVQLWMIES